MYRKVNGERFVAAIIDAIILGIVVAVPTILYLFKDGLEGMVDFMLGGTGFDGAGNIAYSDEYYIFLAISTIIGLVLSVLYFVYMPYKMNGQTLGKKIMRIKAIDDFGNNPTFKQHFIRSVQNWSTYVESVFIVFIFVSVEAFGILTGLASSLVGLLAFVSYLMVLFKEDGRGLHDVWSGTRVVKSDIDLHKQFVEKTTQMSDWAEIEFEDEETEKEEDPWKY